MAANDDTTGRADEAAGDGAPLSTGDNPAADTAPDSTPDSISTGTDNGQVAQAPGGAEPIGQVESMSGTVVAVRADGTRVELNTGDPIYQGDSLETGADGSVGVVLADQTTFSMANNGSMVIDQMVYDPSTNEGSISMSVVEGVFTFVSGQIAKTDPDAMSLNTPVATIGIRGTQVGIEVGGDKSMNVVLMEEADGFVGEVVVANDGGVQILNQAFQATNVASSGSAPSATYIYDTQTLIQNFKGALGQLPSTNDNNANNYGVRPDDVQRELTQQEQTQSENLTDEQLAEEEATEKGKKDEEQLAQEGEGEPDPNELNEFDTAAGGEEPDPEQTAEEGDAPPPPIPTAGDIPPPPPVLIGIGIVPPITVPTENDPPQLNDLGGNDDDDDDDDVTVIPETAELGTVAGSGTGDEDSPIALNLTTAIPGGDDDVVQSVTISGLPTGATLSTGTDNGDGTFTVNVADISGLMITPPAGSSLDFSINVAVTTLDVDGNVSATSAPTSIDVKVDAVADEGAVAGGGTGDEGTAIALNLSTSIPDGDDDTVTEITLSGLPAGSTLSAGTDNGDGTFTVDAADIAGLTITPGANSPVDFSIDVAVTTQDVDPDTSEVVTTTSGTTPISAHLDEVDDEASTPNITAGNVDGTEDFAVTLDLTAGLVDTDGSETLSVTISGVPTGASLSFGTDNGDGSWTISSAADLANLGNLQLNPPADFSGVLNLNFEATATESNGGAIALASTDFTVDVSGVADDPTASAQDATGDEDTAIDLDVSAATTDIDGSEDLSVTISGIPTGAVLSLGTDNEDDTWTIDDPAELVNLSNLQLTPPADFFGTIDLSVQATASEDGTEASTAPIDFTVTVEDTGEVIVGTPQDDVLQGGEQDDDISGKAGDDVIDGAGGDDIIDGGSGDDVITGGEGDDVITGGEGNDDIDGGQGEDLILGEAGDDIIDGGQGDDLIFGGEGNDDIEGGQGDDWISGGAGDDIIDGGQGNDVAIMGGNFDDFSIIQNTDGTISISGPSGDDTLIDIEGLVFNDSPVDTTTEPPTPIPLNISDIGQPPEVSISPASGNEDGAIPLNVFIEIANPFADLTSITIEGVPTGATLSLGTDNGGGSWTISSQEDFDDLASLTITPVEGDSTDLSLGVSVTVVDIDLTGENLTLPLTSDPIALPVTVDAIVEDATVTTTDTSGAEDTAIDLDITASLPAGSDDTITEITINDIPADATLALGSDNLPLTGPDVNGNFSVTLSGQQLQDYQDGTSALTITPDAGDSTDFSVDVVVTTQDVDPETGAITTASTDVPLNVTVAAVADTGAVSGSGAGLEDTAIALNLDASIPTGDDDTIEALTITGLPTNATLAVDPNSGLTLNGSVVEGSGPDGSFTPADLQALANGVVTVTPAAGDSTDFSVDVVVTTQDVDPDTGAVSSVDSVATPVAVTVDAVADTGTVAGGGAGLEDTAIPLNLTTDIPGGDDDTVESITISGLPEGATLSIGSDGAPLEPNDQGEYVIDAADICNVFTTPPENSNVDFSLDVAVTTQDVDPETGAVTTTSTPTAINVAVTGVADLANLAAGNVSGGEDTAIPLDIASSLDDTDGSETLSVTITNIPAGATLAIGDNNVTLVEQPDGTFTAVLESPSVEDLQSLTMTPPDDFFGEINLAVSATSTEDDGDTITTAPIEFTVSISDDGEVLIGTPEDDVLTGGGQDDFIDGRAGDDILTGGGGDDEILGGQGDDILDGGAGNDDLDGGQGDDILLGGEGDDVLDGGQGDDDLDGGTGDDEIDGGQGDDIITGDDEIDGGQGDDTAVFGGDFEDYTIVVYENGDVTITGPDGTDSLTDIETLEFDNGSVNVDDIGLPPIITVDTAAGNEDEPIGLDIEVEVANPLATVETVTIEGIPTGSTLMSGTDELLPEADGSYLLSPAQLEDLNVTPPQDFNGNLNLEVTASTSEGLSSDVPTPLPVAVAAVDDAPDVTVGTVDDALEDDTEIELDIAAAVPDSTETVESITIAGVPADATLSAGTDNNDGTWTLDPTQLENLTITPAAGSSADITLQITATSTDGGVSDPVDLNVTIDAVADEGTVTGGGGLGAEDGGPIDLNITTDIPGGDDDTVESITISGLPTGATLSTGTDNGDGTWTVDQADIATLQVTPVAGSSADFDLQIAVTTVDTDPDTGLPTTTTSAATPITVQVAAVADAGVVSGSGAGDEDTAIALNLTASIPTGDDDTVESITIMGLPGGSTLAVDPNSGLTLNGSVVEGSGPNGSFTPADLQALANGAVTVTPAADDNTDFSVDVSVTTQDVDPETGAVSTTSVATPINVTVNAVDDTPDIDLAAPALGGEDTAIDLNLDIEVPDSTETVAEVTISGIPADAAVAFGTDAPLALDGPDASGLFSVTISGNDLNQIGDLNITPPDDSGDDFTLTVNAVSTDGGTTEIPVPVTVNAVADAPTLGVVLGAPTLPTDGVEGVDPITYFKLDQNDNGQVTDEIGEPAGTLHGDAEIVGGGQHGDAVNLDGHHDGIEVPHTDNMMLDSGTITVWFNTANSNDRQGLVSKDSRNFDDGGHFTAFVDDGQLEVRIQSENESFYVEGGNVSSGDWHQMTVSFGSDGFNLYVDGQQVDHNDYTGGLAGNENPWAVGANAWATGDNNSQGLRDFFEGQMDDLAIYDQQLSGEQIQSLYTDGVQSLINAGADAGSDDVTFPLDITSAVTDTDGSETLEVTVAGLPEGASLSAGTDNGDGTWTLTADDLAGLELSVPTEQSDNFDLQITSVSTDIDPDTEAETTASTGPITITIPMEDLNNIVGTEGDDVIIGTDEDDDIDALGGDDVVVGGAGDDTIDGGAGDDILIGDAAVEPAMYLMEEGSDSITRINADGSAEVVVTQDEIKAATGESDADMDNRGIAVDGNGNLFFSEDDSDSILMKPADGGPLQVIATEADIKAATGESHADPKSLTVGNDGNVYVSDDNSDSILRIDPATGDVSVLVSEDTLEDLPGIQHIDLDGGIVTGIDGTIYAASDGNPDAIFAINPETGEASVLASHCPFDDLDVYMTIVPNGDLIVADDSGANTIYRVPTSGEDQGEVSVFLSPEDISAVTGHSVDLEGGISFDADGNFYVAEENSDDIIKFSGYDPEDGTIDPATGTVFLSESQLSDLVNHDADLEGGMAFGGDWTAVNETAGGDDVLIGGEGNDQIYGGGGNDTLDGGADDDALFGGAGDDDLDGGAGFDTAFYAGNYDEYNISFGDGGVITITGPEGTDTLNNIENLDFKNGSVRVEDIGAAPTVETELASGREDNSIGLGITVAVASSFAAVASVMIDNIPAGSVIAQGTDDPFELTAQPDGSMSLTLSPDQLSGLNITPPQDYNGVFDLAVSATSSEGATSNPVNYTVDVAAVNDAAELSGDGQIDLTDGAATIGSDDLQLTDVDNSADELFYQVTDGPDHGDLFLDGTALGEGDLFTQDDIDQGLLQYVVDEGAEEVGEFTHEWAEGTPSWDERTNSVDPENLTMPEGGDSVTITFESEGTNKNDVFGWYKIDENGNQGEHVIWDDTQDDDLESGQTSFTIEGLQPGESFGLFVLQDGDDNKFRDVFENAESGINDDGTLMIGFENSSIGGNDDFNDLIVSVQYNGQGESGPATNDNFSFTAFDEEGEKMKDNDSEGGYSVSEGQASVNITIDPSGMG